MFNQIMITLEEDDADVTEPTGDIMYSSVLPPQALVPMRKVLVTYDQVPDKGPLMQNLWWYNINYINRSINGDPYDENYKTGIVQAYQGKDEATLRKKTEEVINAIVGEQSDQYMDYNGDDSIDNAGDGFGSLPNGSNPGYLQAAILESKNAADAADSTPNIRLNSENAQICLTNVTGWTQQLLQLALKLNDTPFGSQMDPLVQQISDFGNTLLKGQDTNKNGQYEAIAGECGATDGYYYGYWMADMLLYPGQDRIPPPQK
jgi:hypothetical protein